jgi:hypothetical protein
MTTQEIKMEAFRLIDETLILKYNVVNGCRSDNAALEANMKRMPAIKAWAEEVEVINDIRHYFISHNFGQHMQFIVNDFKQLFN